MDILERNEIERAIDYLGKIYFNQLDMVMVEDLKRCLLESGQEFSYLMREIRELWKYDFEKFYTFLEKYGVNIKSSMGVKIHFVSDQFPSSFTVKKNFNGVIKSFEENSGNEKEEFIFDSMEPKVSVMNPDLYELKKITDGMTESEMVEYFKFHGKNPEQIVQILSMLQKENEQVTLLEQPKQLVLKNSKMAAFIDSLTLAFLVGAFSGILFFVILRLCLNALY